MFEREVTINRFLLGCVEKLAESITEVELTLRPAAGGHSPLWILGRLAISPDFAAVPLHGASHAARRTSVGAEAGCP